jgi:hypothetical protein
MSKFDQTHLLVRIVEYLLDQHTDPPSVFVTIGLSLVASLIGAGAAILSVRIAEGHRAKQRYAEAATLLVTKLSAVMNGIWGVRNRLMDAVGAANGAPKKDYWRFLEETSGFLPPPEPLGALELEMLAKHKNAELFSQLAEIENAYRILYASMVEYNDKRTKLFEMIAPFTRFEQNGEKMVASTEFTVDKAPLAPGLMFICGSLVQQSLDLTSDTLPAVKSATEAVNKLFAKHQKDWGVGLSLSFPDGLGLAGETDGGFSAHN